MVPMDSIEAMDSIGCHGFHGQPRIPWVPIESMTSRGPWIPLGASRGIHGYPWNPLAPMESMATREIYGYPWIRPRHPREAGWPKWG